MFTDSLSSLQAVDGNSCNHPFIQDVLKIFNDCQLARKLFQLGFQVT